MWINQLSASCIAALSSTNHNPNFTSDGLIDSNDGLLEQAFASYVMETCPANSAGWFFNPEPIDDPMTNTPGEIDYDIVYQILSNSGCTTPPIFESNTPGTSTINNTNQNFPPCFIAFLEVMNDGIDALNLIGPAPVSTQLVINQTNYPTIYTACEQLTGTLDISSSSGFGTAFIFTDDNPVPEKACDFTLKLKFFDYPDDGILAEDIDHLEGFVKYSSYTHGGTTYPAVVIMDVVLNDLTVVKGFLYGDEFDCFDIGTFDDQEIYSYENPFGSLPDYELDCIESLETQAILDAEQTYNQVLNDLQNQFQQLMISCIGSVDETFTLSYTLKEYQYTLYYYDLAGNLVQTVPPQGVDILDPSHFNGGVWNQVSPNHRMETRYQYNGLNTLIAQYTPDGGHSDFIHDKLYRVRFSQNEKQAFQDRASFSKYDELGRVQQAGEFRIPLSVLVSDLEYMQDHADDETFPNNVQRLDYTITHYETSYPGDNGDIANRFENGQQNLRNAIGAIEHRQADYNASNQVIAGTEVLTVISYSYDPHKNVQQCLTTNYDLENIGHAHKMVEYDYDLISGNVKKVSYQKGYEDEYNHAYHYDANNRLIRAFTSRDGGTTWEKEAKYFYYLHGSLARVELGEDEVQGIDYAYNLQGWLKGVNATTLDADRDLGHDAANGDNAFFGTDVFSYQLGYFKQDYTSIESSSAFSVNDLPLRDLNINDEGSNQNGYSNGSLYNGNITYMLTAMRDADENIMEVMANNYRYDQLQRIKAMDVYVDPYLQANNTLDNLSLYNNGGYQTRYSFDRNGNFSTLKRNASDGTLMDDLQYYYYESSNSSTQESIAALEMSGNWNTNRLGSVKDFADDYSNIDDITNQNLSNYIYDEIGQLITDVEADIEKIVWTVTGKVKEIHFTPESEKNNLKFVYDPMDMRIMKIEYLEADKSAIQYTYYTYDPQGNLMASYDRQIINTASGSYTDELKLNEHLIYGASRLGSDNRNMLLLEADISQSSGDVSAELRENFQWSNLNEPTYDHSHRRLGLRTYELSNHLGNVHEVITDRKIEWNDNGTLIYTADVISYSDYYPYGMLLEHRHGSEGENYRYGFQGQEMDDEVGKGHGNSINYKYRMHDPRIGRFFAVDPLSPQYPELTPYQFSSNSPIYMSEIEGLEGQVNIYNDNGSGPKYDKEQSYTDPNLNQDINRTDNWKNGERTSVEIKTLGGDPIIEYGKLEHYNANQINRIVLKDYINNRFPLASQNSENAHGIYGGSIISQYNGEVLEQVTSNTLIKYGPNVAYPEYQFIYPQDQGSIGTLGSDGLYWKGCLSCHSPIGAYNYAAFNSSERTAGIVIGTVLPMAMGSNIGAISNAAKTSSNVLSKSELLRIENAATRINKPITVVGSRAKGTAGAYSDWDYVIPGLTSKNWSTVKNSLPGSRSILDNTPRNIDIFKGPIDVTKPHITINPRY